MAAMYRVISLTFIALATMATHASAQNQPPRPLVPRPSALSTITAKAEDAAGALLGTSAIAITPTGLVPTLVSVLPQVVIQSIPTVVPVGDPVSER